MIINTSTSNFDHIYGKGYLYVDKTRFLTEWWREGESVTMITRPRRFGKSLLLSTVNHYFSDIYKDEKKMDGSPLFEGLDVWKDEDMRHLQGSMPVLSLTLSGCARRFCTLGGCPDEF